MMARFFKMILIPFLVHVYKSILHGIWNIFPNQKKSATTFIFICTHKTVKKYKFINIEWCNRINCSQTKYKQTPGRWWWRSIFSCTSRKMSMNIGFTHLVANVSIIAMLLHNIHRLQCFIKQWYFLLDFCACA